MKREKLCDNYKVSRIERQNELDRGLIGDGTFKYSGMGCYECNGFNYKCRRYTNLKSFEKWLEERG